MIYPPVYQGYPAGYDTAHLPPSFDRRAASGRPG